MYHHELIKKGSTKQNTNCCMCYNFWAFKKNVLLLSFTNVLGQNDKLQKDSLQNIDERNMFSKLAVLAHKVFKISQQKKKVNFLVLVNHPAVHSGGVRRGRARSCGCWREWHVTDDRWHATRITLLVTHDTWLVKFFFFFLCISATICTHQEIQCLPYGIAVNTSLV